MTDLVHSDKINDLLFLTVIVIRFLTSHRIKCQEIAEIQK